MICTTCFGKRRRLVAVSGGGFAKRLELRPCPACQGLGFLGCDGLREQPDGRRLLTVKDSWITPTVLFLAQAAYAGDWDTLFVLADALEEAGCPAEACERDPSHRRTRCEHTTCAECESTIVPHPLLAHLRGPGPHVRGCWALDLVLGKG